jgi:hypothetical protein
MYDQLGAKEPANKEECQNSVMVRVCDLKCVVQRLCGMGGDLTTVSLITNGVHAKKQER